MSRVQKNFRPIRVGFEKISGGCESGSKILNAPDLIIVVVFEVTVSFGKEYPEVESTEPISASDYRLFGKIEPFP